MDENSYRKALEEARKELADLPRQRQIANEFFDQRESHLAKIIEGLEPVCEPINVATSSARTLLDVLSEEGRFPGLQESIAAILRAHAPSMLAPTAVRDELERVGLNTTNYSNPMATIHRALGRLADDPKSKIQAVTKEGKTVGYKYAGVPPEPVGMAELIRRFVPTKRNEYRDAAERLGLVRKEPTIKLSPREKKS